MTCRPTTLLAEGLPAAEGRVSWHTLCAGIEVTIITPHAHASTASGKMRHMWTGPHKELKKTVTSFLMPTHVIHEYSVSVLCAPAWSARLLSSCFLRHCELLSETAAKKLGFLLSSDSLLVEQRDVEDYSQQITRPALRKVSTAGDGSPKKTAYRGQRDPGKAKTAQRKRAE